MKILFKALGSFVSKLTQLLIILIINSALLSADDVLIKQHEFPDSHTGKTIGLIKIVKNDEQNLPIKIIISSVGIEVQAFQDFTGIRGYNLLTAKTLASILAKKNSFDINIKNLSSNEITKANISLNEQDQFPIRRLNLSGDIEFLAKTTIEYPKSIVVSANTLKDGDYEVEFVMNEQVRLILPFVVKGELLTYDLSKVERKIKNLLTASNTVVLFEPEKEKGSKDIQNLAEIDLKIWNKLQFESKWIYFISAIDKNPMSIPRWIDFLISNKEYKILEWYLISNRNGFDDYDLGLKLFEADAPNWISILCWIYINSDEHMNMSKDKILKQKPELIKSWVDKHKISAPTLMPKLLNVSGGADVKKYSEPIDVNVVLKHLDCPDEVLVLKSEDKVLENKVYQHQVIRAINVLKGTKGIESHLPKLLKLTNHKNEDIAQNAFLAYTGIPSLLIPRAEFLNVSKDINKSNKIREAAFMAFTFSDHPSVYAEIHQLASEPLDPCWRTAISRLGDLGDDFSLFYLKSLLDKFSAKLPKDKIDIYNVTLNRLKPQSEQKLTKEKLYATLLNGAYIDLTCGPLENVYKNWLEDYLKKKSIEDETKKMMKQLDQEIGQNKDVFKTEFGDTNARIKLYLKPFVE